MKKVITYGTFDLLHYGHIALLKRAKALGDYLIVGVTSDAFDKARGKLDVNQSVLERVEAVKKTGLADKIIVEEFEGQKISDIQKYDIDIFTIGSDWISKFDYLNDYCQLVYLPRTEGVSSTEIRVAQKPIIKLGLVGLENPADRFLLESKYVNGLKAVKCFCEDKDKLKSFSNENKIPGASDWEELMSEVDAIYISETIDKHYTYITNALKNGKHVICESPMFLSSEEAKEAFALAKEKNLVLMEAVKTLFYPAFEHLLLVVGSNVIGEIKDIDVSFSQNPKEDIFTNKYKGSMYDLGSYVLLPIIKLLGSKFISSRMFTYKNNDFSFYTKGFLQFRNAIATYKAGKGIKTEGNLVITGTKGYVYVPAPWWKIDYFEIRYEDLRDTKKYFYKAEGDGFRYEQKEFVRLIRTGILESYKYTIDEMRTIATIIEKFDKEE